MEGDRMRQVNELVRSKVSEILVRDVDLSPEYFVTILSVDTSRDLRHSNIYITVIPDNKRGSALRALESASGRMRKILGSRIQMKYTPQLHFRIDPGEAKAQHIRDVMDEVENESKSGADGTAEVIDTEA